MTSRARTGTGSLRSHRNRRRGSDHQTSVAKPSGELHDVTGVWVYSLRATTTRAMTPRTAIKPAMIPDIEYGMVPTVAFSAFIC